MNDEKTFWDYWFHLKTRPRDAVNKKRNIFWQWVNFTLPLPFPLIMAFLFVTIENFDQFYPNLCILGQEKLNVIISSLKEIWFQFYPLPPLDSASWNNSFFFYGIPKLSLKFWSISIYFQNYSHYLIHEAH